MDKGKRRAQRRRREREAKSDGSVVIPVVQRERSVLVVEADPEVQVQMARALRRQGHRVVGTSSGDGALALVRQWDVDLILVSEDLPGRAGVEVTRMIHAARPHAPVVVMMSSNVEASVCAAAREAGAVDCVVKPLEVESLTRWLSPLNNALSTREAVAE